MTESYRSIRELIDRVRRRWRTLHAFEAIVRAAIASTVVVGIALTIALWTNGAPGLLAAVGIVAVVLMLAAVVWGLLPLREVPDDRHVARFIEERAPTLDDRLVSAVDVASASSDRPAGLADAMLADAARRVREVEPALVISSESLRRAGFQAAAARPLTPLR